MKKKVIIGVGLLIGIGAVVLAAWQVPEVKEVFGITVYPEGYCKGSDRCHETWK